MAPTPPPQGWLRWAAWIVAAAAVVVYANTFDAGYTLDDVPIVKENQLITSLDVIPQLFRLDYWHSTSGTFEDHSVYRPLTMVTYALNYAVHGYRPAGYHIVNVLLHALVSALLFLLIRSVFETPRVAFVAALLFAVHPIHTEAVSGIVGRAELLALLGTLICCLGYERARQAVQGAGQGFLLWAGVSVLGYLMGMFSKETGVVAVAFIGMWELVCPKRRWALKWDLRGLALCAALGGALVLFLSVRSQVVQRSIHEGFVGLAGQERVLTALRVCLEYVGMMLAPVRLSADYWTTDVLVAKSVTELGVFLALVVLAGAGALAVWAWRRSPAVSWGLGAFAMALFPVSNLPFAIGVLKAERILYTPSAGFLVALAALLPLLWKRPALARWAWVLVWVVTGLYAGRTMARNLDWRDNAALAAATLRTSPDSPTFQTIMGGAYRERKENAQAREHYLKALEQRPKDATGWFNVGNIELDERRFDKAIEYYNKALALKTNHFDAINNLGMAYYESRRLPEAVQTFKRLLVLRPDSLAVTMNLVSAYFQMQDLASALPVAEDASRRFSNSAGVLWNLGMVYQGLGRTNEARQAFERSVQIDPSIRNTPNFKGKL